MPTGVAALIRFDGVPIRIGAADPAVAAMAPHCPGDVTFFALDVTQPVLAAHRAQGSSWEATGRALGTPADELQRLMRENRSAFRRHFLTARNDLLEIGRAHV